MLETVGAETGPSPASPPRRLADAESFEVRISYRVELSCFRPRRTTGCRGRPPLENSVYSCRYPDTWNSWWECSCIGAVPRPRTPRTRCSHRGSSARDHGPRCRRRQVTGCGRRRRCPGAHYPDPQAPAVPRMDRSERHPGNRRAGAARRSGRALLHVWRRGRLGSAHLGAASRTGSELAGATVSRVLARPD